jgi:hypothetical protein
LNIAFDKASKITPSCLISGCLPIHFLGGAKIYYFKKK